MNEWKECENLMIAYIMLFIFTFFLCGYLDILAEPSVNHPPFYARWYDNTPCPNMPEGYVPSPPYGYTLYLQQLTPVEDGWLVKLMKRTQFLRDNLFRPRINTPVTNGQSHEGPKG